MAYNKQLGAALNYGQSMQPGKSPKGKQGKNVQRAVLSKRKPGAK